MKICEILLFVFIICEINGSLIFKFNPGEEQCFHDVFFSDSSIIIKYKFFTPSKENITSILQTISFNVRYENSENKLHESKIKGNKSKATFTVVHEGMYKICFLRKKYYGKDGPKEQLYGNIKITSNSMDDVKLDDVVSTTDIDTIYNKTNYIRDLTDNIIDFQNSQMEMENASSQETIYYTKWYKYITTGQIIITLIVGATQLNNFRRFLKSQHII